MAERTTPVPPLQRYGALAVLAALVILFVVMRYVPPSVLYGDGFLVLSDPDSYYHLRRVTGSLATFPSLLDFDPLLSYPHGEWSPWPPLFDTLSTALVLLSGRSLMLVPWVNLACGIGTLAAVFIWTCRRYGLLAATLGGLVLVTSGEFVIMHIAGKFDHHALEYLIVAGAYLAFLGLREEVTTARTAALAALVAASFLNWPGAIVYYPPMLVTVLRDRVRRDGDRREAFATAAAFGFSAGVIALFAAFSLLGRAHPYSYKFLGGFQRDACLLAALYCIAVGRLRWGWRHAAVALSCTVAAAVLFRPFLAEIAGGISFLAGGDAQMVRSTESEALFGSSSMGTWLQIVRMLFFHTPAVLLVPLLVLPPFARRVPAAAVEYVLYFTVLSFVQVRFGGFLVVGLALLAGISSTHLKGRLLPSVAIVIMLSYGGWVGNRNGTIHETLFTPAEYVEMGRFFRTSTPDDAAFRAGRPPWGVLSPWFAGNHVVEPGGRAAIVHAAVGVTAHNDPGVFDRAILVRDETALAGMMDSIGARYIVLPNPAGLIGEAWRMEGDGTGNPYVRIESGVTYPTARMRDLAAYRLYRDDGMSPGFPAASRFRLVFETGNGGGRQGIRVFERVPGAHVVAPGGRAVLVARIVTPERMFEYRSSGTATARGTEFTVPYSFDAAYPVRAAGMWVETGGRRQSLMLTERDVQSSSTVVVR